MDFRGAISAARSNASLAISELGRYDRSMSPDAPGNRAVLDKAAWYISPGATRAGAEALDAARWERWVSVRQIRDVGTALQLLDRAWWNVRPGRPDIDGARSALYDAVRYLESATWSSGRWITPAVAA